MRSYMLLLLLLLLLFISSIFYFTTHTYSPLLVSSNFHPLQTQGWSIHKRRRKMFSEARTSSSQPASQPASCVVGSWGSFVWHSNDQSQLATLLQLLFKHLMGIRLRTHACQLSPLLHLHKVQKRFVRAWFGLGHYCIRAKARRKRERERERRIGPDGLTERLTCSGVLLVSNSNQYKQLQLARKSAENLVRAAANSKEKHIQHHTLTD